MGDEIWVKCIGVDEKGRVKLSRKAAMEDRGEAVAADAEKAGEPRPEGEGRPPREGGPTAVVIAVTGVVIAAVTVAAVGVAVAVTAAANVPAVETAEIEAVTAVDAAAAATLPSLPTTNPRSRSARSTAAGRSDQGLRLFRRIPARQGRSVPRQRVGQLPREAGHRHRPGRRRDLGRKVLGVDEKGRIRLSRKAAMEDREEGTVRPGLTPPLDSFFRPAADLVSAAFFMGRFSPLTCALPGSRESNT